MDPRKTGGVTSVVGVLVTVVPFIWELVPEPLRDSPPGTTVEFLLNPGALAGGVMAPGYPIGLGMVAIGIGLSMSMIDEIELDPWKSMLVGAGGGVFFGLILALGATQGEPVETARMSLLGAAPGIAAVIGAGTERTQQLVGVGVLVFMVLPTVGWLFSVAATAEGWGRFLAPAFLLIFLLFTGVYSFPFLQLGRGLRKTRFRMSQQAH